MVLAPSDGAGFVRHPPTCAGVSPTAHETPAWDEVQRSEDELVVLLLMRASGMQQKCRHADSSRGRVREWNELGRADNGRSEYRDPTDAGVSAALNRTLVLIRHPPGAQIDAHNSRLRPAGTPPDESGQSLPARAGDVHDSAPRGCKSVEVRVVLSG